MRPRTSRMAERHRGKAYPEVPKLEPGERLSPEKPPMQKAFDEELHDDEAQAAYEELRRTYPQEPTVLEIQLCRIARALEISSANLEFIGELLNEITPDALIQILPIPKPPAPTKQ